MKTIYGLSAKGDSCNGWPFTAKSKRLFWTVAKAEEYIPEFRAKCLDPSYFDFAIEDKMTLSIKVEEHEIEDELESQSTKEDANAQKQA